MVANYRKLPENNSLEIYCMSMLPPSAHPTTGQYHWINSPLDTEVAIAPQWIAQLMGTIKTKPKNFCTNTKVSTPPSIKQSIERQPTISLELARLLLEVLPPSLADDYHTWLRVGMALHYISDCLLGDWDKWSQSSHKYQPGECDYLWSRFVVNGGITHKTLFWLANKNSCKKIVVN